MNEFTKEELEIIYSALMRAGEGPAAIELEHVQEKIQRMIETDCKHYWDWVTDPRLHFMSNPPKIKCVCTKCHAIKYINIIDINKPE